jgi:hypothetical protein
MEAVEENMASALAQVIQDTARSSRLKDGARKRAASFSHRERVEEMVERFYSSA